MNEIPGLSRAALHRARISRDARFDGKFYIAVLTTGVYCRPICPSPQSKKSNVRYYATAAAAAAAGYRPCRRCRPEVAPGTAAWLGASAVVRRALRLIQAGALDEGTVDELALRVGVGPRHLDRLFAEHVGVAPIAVAQTRRLHFAKQLLDETNLPITQVAMSAGFGSLRRFNETYHATFGCTPRATRQRISRSANRNQHISLTLHYRPPYDWHAMAGFLERHAIRGVEHVSLDGYARTIRLANGYACVRVAPLRGQHALRLQLSGAEPSDLFDIASGARRVFDLSADPAAIAEVLAADPLLRSLTRQRPGLRIPGVWDAFECAVRAVLAHSMSESAAQLSAERLVRRVGERVDGAHARLTHLFPSARRMAKANLQGLGLTAAAIAGLRTLARAVCDDTLNLAAPTDQVVRALAALDGVGPWGAQYVALRALGEPDAFPCDDLLIRRAARPNGSSTDTVADRAETWRPWRGYATVHLWLAAADQLSQPDALLCSPPGTSRHAAGHRTHLA
jgi:AraC family transcriptional regulator, regulatory protein of adaptative response / DNA-3-methyladenine glycosylase II